MKYTNNKVKKYLFLFILFAFGLSVDAFAISLNQLMIVSEDGTFLGSFESEYFRDSIYNQYGKYGSKYETKSIFNKYGDYGSDYSDKTPFNKYANKAPWLVDRQGNRYGRLSINKYANGVTNDSYKLALQLKALRDSL